MASGRSALDDEEAASRMCTRNGRCGITAYSLANLVASASAALQYRRFSGVLHGRPVDLEVEVKSLG
jgi:hypothetical protein